MYDILYIFLVITSFILGYRCITNKNEEKEKLYETAFVVSLVFSVFGFLLILYKFL